jgi:hypothetical protein
LRKITKVIVSATSIIIIGLMASCGIIRYDHSFCGKVVDRETNEPISGVVIIGDWENVTPTVAGAVHSVNTISEVITNKDGTFRLNGRGFVFMVDEPQFEIFKSGYDNVSITFYILNSPYTLETYYKDKVIWNTKEAIIRLKKLSPEERVKNYGNVGNNINAGISMTQEGVKQNKKIIEKRKLFNGELEKERDFYDSYRQQQERLQRRSQTPVYGVPASKKPNLIKSE